MMSHKQNGGLRYLDEKMTQMPLGLHMTHFRAEQTKAKPCLKIPFHPCSLTHINYRVLSVQMFVCGWTPDAASRNSSTTEHRH